MFGYFRTRILRLRNRNCHWYLGGGIMGVDWVATAIGIVSGRHINPAVSLGVLLQQKLTKKKDYGFKEFSVYVAAQFLGGLIGAAALFGILTASGYSLPDYGIFATNGVVTDTGGYIGGFVAEIVLTFVFVYVILIGIGLTGTSVNPARSFGPAVFQAVFGGGTMALEQIWIFLLAPLVGAALAAVVL